MSTASDIAAVKAAVTALQQRCSRLEAQVADLRAQLARVKKG